MATVSLKYGLIESNAINALDSAISTLSTVIDFLQQTSVPGDFYIKTTFVNAICELKAQRESLVNLKNG